MHKNTLKCQSQHNWLFCGPYAGDTNSLSTEKQTNDNSAIHKIKQRQGQEKKKTQLIKHTLKIV